jgi:integrase
MAKKNTRDLTAKEIEAIIRRGVVKSHPVGSNLYLRINKGGSIDWVFRYQLRGKRTPLGMGGYDSKANNLAIVRRKVNQAKVNINQGIDPLELKREEKIAAKTKAAQDRHTFESVALEYIESKKAEWKNIKHHQQWINTLYQYAFPVIGKLPVSAIDTNHILAILKPIWNTKTETATRVRTRIEAVLSYAEAHQWRSDANPARWRGHLSVILPSPQKLKDLKHHAALPYSELPAFMQVLSNTDGVGARALSIAILTASRTTEVLQARWDEISFHERTWSIPKERMKAGIEHRIPLSDQAIKIFRLLESHRMSDWIFPNRTNGHHLSNAGMSSVLKRMGRTDITVHGFRSSFRDYVAEKTSTPPRIAEAALAHKLKDSVEAAYQRSDLLDKRRVLMQTWANYCLEKSKKVVQLRA